MTRCSIRRLAIGSAVTIPFIRPARAADTIRLGLPTKAYWPTILATAAGRQGFFAKAGIDAELNVYRGGAECFEVLAAEGSRPDPGPALPSRGRAP